MGNNEKVGAYKTQVIVPKHNYFYISPNIDENRGHKFHYYGFIDVFVATTWENYNIAFYGLDLDLQDVDGFDFININGLPSADYTKNRYLTLDYEMLKWLVYDRIVGMEESKMEALRHIKEEFIEHDIKLTDKVKSIFQSIYVDDKNQRRFKI